MSEETWSVEVRLIKRRIYWEFFREAIVYFEGFEFVINEFGAVDIIEF